MAKTVLQSNNDFELQMYMRDAPAELSKLDRAIVVMRYMGWGWAEYEAAPADVLERIAAHIAMERKLARERAGKASWFAREREEQKAAAERQMASGALI